MMNNGFIKETSNRHAWRQYASAAITGLIAEGKLPIDEIVEKSAVLADDLLKEERKRFPIKLG